MDCTLSKTKVIMLDPGGFTPQYDYYLCRSLADIGWSVTLCTSRHQFGYTPPSSGNLPVRSCFFSWFGCSGLSLLARSTATRRLIKGLTYPFDLYRFGAWVERQTCPLIVHVQWALWPWFDQRLWKKCRQNGIRTVYTVHDSLHLPGSLPGFLNRQQAKLFSVADALIVHDDYTRAICTSSCRQVTLHTIPPGSPVPHAPTPSEPMSVRHHLGVPPGAQVILFFGYIKPYKGLELLLQALAKLRKDTPRAHLLIAGECQQSDKRYVRLIRRLQCMDAVTWHKGYVPEERVADFFVASNVVALPYHRASSSGVLLTAFAHGRTVVVTRVGGLPELVENGKTGLLIPPGNVNALVLALDSLLKDPERNRTLASGGRKSLQQKHCWGDIARQTAKIYNTLLKTS